MTNEDKGGYVDKDGIYIPTEEEISKREHWSEYHGWD